MTTRPGGTPTAEPAVSVGQATSGAPGAVRGHVPWISWARIVAIVGVVAIHVSSHLVLSWGTVSAKQWHFGNLLQSASRFSVPLFVMVSGAMLLAGRPGERPGEFFRRRFARIGIPLVVWTCFFLVLDAWSHDRPVTAYTFVQGFLWGRPYYHLYFLYALAGLYLLTPFLRVFVAAADRRTLVAATATCLGIACADKLQHTFMGGGGFNAFTYFLPFVGYYLLGHVVATTRLRWSRRRMARWSALAFVAAMLVTHVGTWWMFGAVGVQRGRVLYEYYLPTALVGAVAAAFLLRAVFGDGGPSASGWLAAHGARVRWVADLTMGVYLLHPIPLELLVRRDQPTFASAYVDMGFHVGVIVALLVGCALVTAVLRAVPLARRLV